MGYIGLPSNVCISNTRRTLAALSAGLTSYSLQRFTAVNSALWQLRPTWKNGSRPARHTLHIPTKCMMRLSDAVNCDSRLTRQPPLRAQHHQVSCCCCASGGGDCSRCLALQGKPCCCGDSSDGHAKLALAGDEQQQHLLNCACPSAVHEAPQMLTALTGKAAIKAGSGLTAE